MTDQFSIITTLVTGFGLALVFGWLAERFLKTPTLVGYIIAGVSVGLFPLLPNVDRVVTEQFAEIGVMLLMFGVGLHFSVADLVKVKGVAVTGAMLQMAASGAAGTAVALLAWDWALPNAIVFGMTLSCASTVVVMKALELHKLSVTPSGQVAIGWLVVQDLVTVFIMVCLPLVAQVTQGEGPVDPRLIVISLSKTLLGVAVFVAGMLIVGKRLFPWILQRVALSGSRELFTLCVLAIAIGIAYGAGAIFNVSYALGAFFAGMVMRESSFCAPCGPQLPAAAGRVFGAVLHLRGPHARPVRLRERTLGRDRRDAHHHVHHEQRDGRARAASGLAARHGPRHGRLRLAAR